MDEVKRGDLVSERTILISHHVFRPFLPWHKRREVFEYTIVPRIMF